MSDGKTRQTGKSAARRAQHVVLVTGASGAGRTTALRALEDFGYEVIDNMPMRLIPRLITGEPPDHPLVLGIDVRTRGFSAAALAETIDELVADPRLDVELLFLECRATVLSRRYSETRRRHPLSPDDNPMRGIEREIDLLEPIRARSDMLIDTSDITVHELKAELQSWIGLEDSETLSVAVQSFSYKRGVPRGLDLVFDVRFLRNPHWNPELRPLTGQDDAVARYVAGDPRYDEFFDRICGLIEFLLPAYSEEGKAHLSIGFGCTGGRHRSVALAEAAAKRLAAKDWRVSIRHRELEAPAAMAGQGTGGRPSS